MNCTDKTNNDLRVYALYSLIDNETTRKYGQKTYTLSPNLVIKHKALNNLLRLAFKRYYGIDLPECDIYKNGNREFEGVCFGIALCERAVCITVGNSHEGVGIQVPIFVDEEDYAKRYFSDSEYLAWQNREHDNETFLYMLSKKSAYRHKFSERRFTDMKQIDSCLQSEYTLLKDYINNEPYYFAATGKVQFIKTEVKIILP